MACEIAAYIPLETGQRTMFSTESPMCQGLIRLDQWSAVRLYSVVGQNCHRRSPDAALISDW
jgi:hypothetical protein